MKPYIEPKDKHTREQYNYYLKGYLKGYVSQEFFINYCQMCLQQIIDDNAEVLKRMREKKAEDN